MRVCCKCLIYLRIQPEVGRSLRTIFARGGGKRKHAGTHRPLLSDFRVLPAKIPQLPDELKYVPLLESGSSPRRNQPPARLAWAVHASHRRITRLHIDAYVDERMNPNKATEAAVIMLSERRKLGDWSLVLAAYNCGR